MDEKEWGKITYIEHKVKEIVTCSQLFIEDESLYAPVVKWLHR